MRERGLKLFGSRVWTAGQRRSREGAWIEIPLPGLDAGADAVAPVRERGLKFRFLLMKILVNTVAPVRERGLKLR